MQSQEFLRGQLQGPYLGCTLVQGGLIGRTLGGEGLRASVTRPVQHCLYALVFGAARSSQDYLLVTGIYGVR